MPYSYQVTRIEKLMIMKLVTIYILILILLLSCTSKKDSNTQATIDSLVSHQILQRLCLDSSGGKFRAEGVAVYMG